MLNVPPLNRLVCISLCVCIRVCVHPSCLTVTDDICLSSICLLLPGERVRRPRRRVVHVGRRPGSGQERLQQLRPQRPDGKDGRPPSREPILGIRPFLSHLCSVSLDPFTGFAPFQTVSLQKRMRLQLLYLTAGMKTSRRKAWWQK